MKATERTLKPKQVCGHSASCLQSKHLGDGVVFYVWISRGVSQSSNSLLISTNINLVVFYWLNTNIYRPQAPLNISPLPLRSRPHSLLVQGRESWCLAEEQLGPSVSPWVSALIQNRAFNQKLKQQNTRQKYNKVYRFNSQPRASPAAKAAWRCSGEDGAHDLW